MIGLVERDCDVVTVERAERTRREAPVRVLESAPCPPVPRRPAVAPVRPVPPAPAGLVDEVVRLGVAMLVAWIAWEISRWGGA